MKMILETIQIETKNLEGPMHFSHYQTELLLQPAGRCASTLEVGSSFDTPSSEEVLEVEVMSTLSS
jgi:hypothetical protein